MTQRYALPAMSPANSLTMPHAPASCRSASACDTLPLRRLSASAPSGDHASPHLFGLAPVFNDHARHGVDMFDAFIINRIRRERQQEQERRIPLHIEMPRPPEHEPRGRTRSPERNPSQEPESERGVVIVDYSI